MNFEKPPVNTTEQGSEEPVSSNESVENLETITPAEVSARLISVARIYGPDFWNELGSLNKELEERFGKDHLLKNRLYHSFIGSTPWPGLELVEDDEVNQAIIEKIENLEEQVKSIEKPV